MSFLLNSRIALSVASIAAAAALVVGATFAYFSDTAISENNTLTAGTLDIDLVNQNTTDPFESEVLVTNWAPGQTALVEFDVRNLGSLPVNLRGFATGTWTTNPTLDDLNMVKVTKVERFDGSWVTIFEDTNGITGLFHYSGDGTSTGLIDVAPGARAQLRLTVVLDEDANNDFQGETFTASLQVEAKQTSAPSWP